LSRNNFFNCFHLRRFRRFILRDKVARFDHGLDMLFERAPVIRNAAPGDSPSVATESHRRALVPDAFPYRVFIVIVHENPVRDLVGRSAASLADIVEQRRAHTDAGTVG
jgi:hypothetical protein